MVFSFLLDDADLYDDEDSLIKSHQNNIDRNGVARQNNAVNHDATSVRQMAEWGMRGLQGAFPRLKDKILWEELGERKVFMQLVVYLFNYRTEVVGLNQIKSVYYQQNLNTIANNYADPNDA